MSVVCYSPQPYLAWHGDHGLVVKQGDQNPTITGPSIIQFYCELKIEPFWTDRSKFVMTSFIIFIKGI